MKMKLKPSAPLDSQVVFLGDREGSPLPEQSRYWVAFNSYDLASGGTRWKKLRRIVDLPESQLKEYDFQTRDVVIEYIRRHSPLKLKLQEWWKLDRKKSAKQRPE